MHAALHFPSCGDMLLALLRCSGALPGLNHSAETAKQCAILIAHIHIAGLLPLLLPKMGNLPYIRRVVGRLHACKLCLHLHALQAAVLRLKLDKNLLQSVPHLLCALRGVCRRGMAACEQLRTSASHIFQLLPCLKCALNPVTMNRQPSANPMLCRDMHCHRSKEVLLMNALTSKHRCHRSTDFGDEVFLCVSTTHVLKHLRHDYVVPNRLRNISVDAHAEHELVHADFGIISVHLAPFTRLIYATLPLLLATLRFGRIHGGRITDRKAIIVECLLLARRRRMPLRLLISFLLGNDVGLKSQSLCLLHRITYRFASHRAAHLL
mmetsp:Transcript_129952/g.277520  ORF Transcript_129952/g.277520 Transcript_129952/m.277520 type:complete len:323 (-) Transcript_129952:56-1024(-)